MNERTLQYWRSSFPFIFMMAGAYLLYSQMFSGVWLMDDLPVVVNNPDIRSFGNFLEDFYPGRPLRELTYLVDYRFFGLKPAGYYVQQIFWHGLCSWLVFRLARQLDFIAPIAWFAALLFLIHPVQVEVVANISHRKDSLSLAFCLFSFWAYLYGRNSATNGRRWFLIASLLWGIALSAKQNALALPCVVMVYELHKLPPRYRRSVFPVVILMACLGLLGRLLFLANDQTFKESIGPALLKLGSFSGGSVEQYFLTVCKAWAFMLSKLVYPVDLSMEYTFAVPEQWIDPWVLCGLIGAVVSVLGFFWANRRSTAVYVGLAWFLAFWLPTSNLLGHLSYFAADRYWYSPVVGLSLLASYALWLLLRENLKVFLVFSWLLLSLLGVQTWHQQSLWGDADRFYEHMHRVNPQAVEGLIGLGNRAMDRGDYRKAVDYLQRAFQRSPGNARIIQNLGYLAYLQGQHDAAVGYFQKAIAIKPKMVEAYNNLGSVYDDLGRTEEAIVVLEKALTINPHYEKAYTNLGVVYEKLEQLHKAETLHRRALAESPDYGQAHYHLGNTLYHAGRKQEAMNSYLMATRYSPENEDALYNYAVVANELGQRGVLPATLAKLRALSPQLADQLERELR